MSNPHKYQVGTRLSSLYTLGRDGKPYPKYGGVKTSAGYRAWKLGHDERAELAAPAKTKGTVARINAALKAAGREERLVHGRGYYYLWHGAAPSWYSSSIYVSHLEATKKDFEFARYNVNAMFKENGIAVSI